MVRNNLKRRISLSLVIVILLTMMAGAFAEDIWVCPTCSRESTREMNFCGGCRTRKPEETFEEISGAVNAWVCSSCNHVCPESDLFCTSCGADRSGSDVVAVLIPAPDLLNIHVSPCNIQRIEDTVHEGETVKEYVVTTTAKGLYYLWIADNSAKLEAKFVILDMQGNILRANDFYVSHAAIKCDFPAQYSYTIRMKFRGEAGPFTLCIGEARDSIQIPPFSQIEDSIEFEAQQNMYTFIPDNSGYYRIDLTTIRNGQEVKIAILDDQGYVLKSTDFSIGMGQGIGCELKAGETYTIRVKQCDETGPYTLQIGCPHEIIPISGCGAFGDTMYYRNQKNQYSFIAPSTGKFTFTLAFVNSESRFAITVLDECGNKVGSSSYTGDCKAKLEAGKSYTIEVEQNEGVGSYTVLIEKTE